ncbi:hypothetical protein L218DRAFT_949961 [Marasmius fiardii PR-910]|nr:hypothetical protein L218DRAFT_949961 [Marasmius fiardii PR-910]
MAAYPYLRRSGVDWVPPVRFRDSHPMGWFVDSITLFAIAQHKDGCLGPWALAREKPHVRSSERHSSTKPPPAAGKKSHVHYASDKKASWGWDRDPELGLHGERDSSIQGGGFGQELRAEGAGGYVDNSTRPAGDSQTESHGGEDLFQGEMAEIFDREDVTLSLSGAEDVALDKDILEV